MREAWCRAVVGLVALGAGVGLSEEASAEPASPAAEAPSRAAGGEAASGAVEGASPEAPVAEGFWERVYHAPGLTGDWGGARTTLVEHGITIGVGWMTNIATNPAGGHGWGIAQASNSGASLGLDFERLVGIPGLKAFGSFSYRQGDNLALDRFPARASDQGGPFPLKFQQVYGGETWHLVDVYLQQDLSLFGEHDLSLRVGRLAQFDNFAYDQAWGFYENFAFDGNPNGFFSQEPGAAYVYPFATWAAVVSFGAAFDDAQGLWVRAGVYGADTRLLELGANGTRFDFEFNRGANVMVEAGYKRNWLSRNAGLPAKYSIGGWTTTRGFPRWDGGPTEGTAGGYYLVSQGLFLESDSVAAQAGDAPAMEQYWGTADDRVSRLEGWFFWSTGQFGESQVSVMNSWLEFGTYYRGAIPTRDADVIALAFYYGWFSPLLQDSQVAKDAPPQDYEAGFELGYRFTATEYLYLQPNVMGIFNPGGSHQYGDAFVIGMQAEVNL